MPDKDIVLFLQKNELTEDLTLEEIKVLLAFGKMRNFHQNEIVCKEGEKSREFYIVIQGKLAILKKVGKQFEQFSLISEGQFFGEMAHLENQRRSATIKALEPVQLLSIDLDRLQQEEDKKIIYSKIIGKLAKKLSGHLRRTDEVLIHSLKEKIKIMQAYNQISNTLIHFVVLLAIWFNLAAILKLFPTQKETLDLIFTQILLFLFAISATYVIKSSGYPLSFYGLTLKNWFKSSLTAALYSIPFLIFFIILKWILIHNMVILKGLPLFTSLDNLKAVWWLIALYVFMVPVQEIVARGCLQSCFRNFFKGPSRVLMAILISNLLFQMLHTTKEFWVAVVTLFEGFFWGYIFEKQKTIVGVSVSHAIMGTWGYFIVDFNTVLRIYLSV